MQNCIEYVGANRKDYAERGEIYDVVGRWVLLIVNEFVNWNWGSEYGAYVDQANQDHHKVTFLCQQS